MAQPLGRSLSNIFARISHILPSSHYALVGLLFFAGLELLYGFHHWILPIISGLFIILLVSIILVRYEEGHVFHPTQIILPLFAVIGLIGYGLFLPAAIWLHIYFIGAGFFLFYLLKHGAKQAYPTWNWAFSHLVLFLNLICIFGWRFYLYVPIVDVIVLSLIATFFISLQSLQRLTPRFSESLLLALAIAFVLTQFCWLLLFLPSHFFVQAGIIGILYYIIFHIVQNWYEHGWQRRDIVEYVIVGSIALFIILVTAQWL